MHAVFSLQLQRELRQLKSKHQFEHLLNHCQQNCEGITLTTLLNMPTERVSSRAVEDPMYSY